MRSLLSLDLSIIFTLIFIYIFLRILINSKHNNNIIAKELFLVGFVISILMVLTLSTTNLFAKALLFVPLGFFAFYCLEGNMKDTLVICFLLTIAVQIALLVIYGETFSINNIVLNIVGGLIGIFICNKFIKKAQLRFC
ncbi:VanZ family protein [Terrisporobacter sp.]